MHPDNFLLFHSFFFHALKSQSSSEVLLFKEKKLKYSAIASIVLINILLILTEEAFESVFTLNLDSGSLIIFTQVTILLVFNLQFFVRIN
jgi:hypothetical protein